MNTCTCTTNVCRACRSAARDARIACSPRDARVAARTAPKQVPGPNDFEDYEPCAGRRLKYLTPARRSY